MGGSMSCLSKLFAYFQIYTYIYNNNRYLTISLSYFYVTAVMLYLCRTLRSIDFTVTSQLYGLPDLGCQGCTAIVMRQRELHA